MIWGTHLSGFLLIVPLLVTLLAGTTTNVVEPPDAGLFDQDRLVMEIGDMVITEDNAIVENLELNGTLFIEADNVVVRNTWVYTDNFWTILVSDGSALIEDVEIGHPNFVGQRGLGGDNVTARRVEIHDVEDGIKLGSNSVYDRVWIHHLDSTADGPHGDAIQADGGLENAVVRNSYLDSTGPMGFGNAAAQIETSLGPITNVLIENSYLNGGNYLIFNRDGGYGLPQGVAINNNRLGPNFRYALLSTDGDLEATGNTLADGTPVDLLNNSVIGESVTGETVPTTAGTAGEATTAATTEATAAPTTTAATVINSSVTTTAVAASPVTTERIPAWVWPLWISTVGIAVLVGARLRRSAQSPNAPSSPQVISIKDRRERNIRLKAGGKQDSD